MERGGEAGVVRLRLQVVEACRLAGGRGRFRSLGKTITMISHKYVLFSLKNTVRHYRGTG